MKASQADRCIGKYPGRTSLLCAYRTRCPRPACCAPSKSALRVRPGLSGERQARFSRDRSVQTPQVVTIFQSANDRTAGMKIKAIRTLLDETAEITRSAVTVYSGELAEIASSHADGSAIWSAPGLRYNNRLQSI
jgi:hypothetical protein